MPFIPSYFLSCCHTPETFDEHVRAWYGQMVPRQQDPQTRSVYYDTIAATHNNLWHYCLDAVMALMNGHANTVDTLRRAYCDRVARFVREALLPEPPVRATSHCPNQHAYGAATAVLKMVGLVPVPGTPAPESHQSTFYLHAHATSPAIQFGEWLDKHYA